MAGDTRMRPRWLLHTEAGDRGRSSCPMPAKTVRHLPNSCVLGSRASGYDVWQDVVSMVRRPGLVAADRRAHRQDDAGPGGLSRSARPGRLHRWCSGHPRRAGAGRSPGAYRCRRALTGASAAFNSLEEAAARLADLLESRDCLLVLDDVWDRAHMQPFGSEHVARLVTTRPWSGWGPRATRGSSRWNRWTRPRRQLLLNHVPPDASREADPAALRPALGELAAAGAVASASRDLRRCAPVGDRLSRPLGLGRARLAEGRARRDRPHRLRPAPFRGPQPGSGRERRRQPAALHRGGADAAVRADGVSAGVRVPEPVAARLWSATGAMAGFKAGRLLREYGGTFFRLDAASGVAVRAATALSRRAPGAPGLAAARRACRGGPPSARGLLPAGGRSPWTVPDDGYLYDHLTYHLQRRRGRRAAHADARPGLVRGEAGATSPHVRRRDRRRRAGR